MDFDIIFHEKHEGRDDDQVGIKLSAKTLREIWFRDVSASKPYAQYDLGNQRRVETLRLEEHFVFWSVGVQSAAEVISDDLLMVCA